MRMKNVLICFGVLILCVVGVGFYQGWFVLSSNNHNNPDNKVDVKLTVDPDKAKADAEKVKAKAKSLTGQSTTKTPAASSDKGSKPNE